MRRVGVGRTARAERTNIDHLTERLVDVSVGDVLAECQWLRECFAEESDAEGERVAELSLYRCAVPGVAASTMLTRHVLDVLDNFGRCVSRFLPCAKRPSPLWSPRSHAGYDLAVLYRGGCSDRRHLSR